VRPLGDEVLVESSLFEVMAEGLRAMYSTELEAVFGLVLLLAEPKGRFAEGRTASHGDGRSEKGVLT
jgi:hypothetical protein